MPTNLEELQKSWIQLKEERDTFETQFYASEKKVLELTKRLHEEQSINAYVGTKRRSEPPNVAVSSSVADRNPPKSFAQALTGVCDIPTSQLPQVIVKGDRLSITIPEDEYKAGLEECKNNLHGRILRLKGSSPLTIFDLRKKLAILWSNLKSWGVLSLGKGFYEFNFCSAEDMRRVRASGFVSLNPGTLKLFAWSRDFNLACQQNSSAQVWVRFFGLPQEYWRPRILFVIASSIGTPICIDSAASKSKFDRTFRQYVRVLVDMDITQKLNHNVLVERAGFTFFLGIEYENLLEYYNQCKRTENADPKLPILNLLK
ncbi:uncharacterized protein LOC131645406 [Vicia villosa]|uniref:uncharacterized protein LOC131645406 n=1 Tax=Vicia villosa TaxID=3911 RepID=UPI00273C71DE|nr:uncharacterized protein LOC131645406 [Vicia villosa]